MSQGLKTSLAPDTVKVGLDEVFFSRYNQSPAPAHVSAGDPMVFQQATMDNGGYITEIMTDGGLFTARTEEEDAEATSIIAGDKKTHVPVEYAQRLPIPQVYFEDAMYGTVQESVRKMARKAQLTQLKESMAAYRNAFTTFTTNNGIALVSDSQQNLNGDTINNQITDILGETGLNNAINALYEQKDQTGDNVGFDPHCLLVPNRLYITACQTVKADFRPNTANNDPNVFSSEYNISVKQSNYIGAANGGSDVAWFLLSQDHTVTRRVRIPLQTEFRPWSQSDNFVNYYLARFREVVYALTYEGLVGSTGAGS